MPRLTEEEIKELKRFIQGQKGLEDYLNPIGTILPYAGKIEPRNPKNKKADKGYDPKYEGVPNGWLLCDGRNLSETKYEKLFEVLLDHWGQSGEKVFVLPDLRGKFLRGVTDDSNIDPDCKERYNLNQDGVRRVATGVGSYQDDAIEKHSHALGAGSADSTAMAQNNHPGHAQRLAHFNSDNYNKGARKKSHEYGEALETRPKNAYVYWIIKAK
jgi:microcystin-dependent protein